MGVVIHQQAFTPEDRFDIGAWRSENRRRAHFGLKPAPMPAINGEQAAAWLRRAYNASWEPLGITRDEYRREVAAIEAARSKPLGEFKQRRVDLIERDGTDCWFCGEHMPEHDRTIEHKVPRSRGGSDDLSNLALAHQACNRLMGDAPLHVKQAMRAGSNEQENGRG